MKLLIYAIVFPLIAFASGHFEWLGTNRNVGIVIDGCKLTNKGIDVSFYSDMPPPYVVGVYHMNMAQFRTPRYPIKKVFTSTQNAFIRGDYRSIPVFVCVMSEPLIPTNVFEHIEIDEFSVAETNDFGLSTLNEEVLKTPYYTKKGYIPRVQERENWGYFRGVHSDFDGSLYVNQFGEKVKVNCTFPSDKNWMSEYVLIPVPFVSMSSNNGLRWSRSDDGVYYWQRDTNSIPRKITFGDK